MPEQTTAGALVKRVTQMASLLPKTPAEIVERIREMRSVAHVLSPAVTAASIPEHITINTVVEVIDTTVDAKTGRGNDIYFQASIHKSDRQGRGDDAVVTPLEGSLNATAIKRILAAAGVSVTHSDQIPTGDQNHWKWQSKGKMRDFDGSWRELPPGTAEIDLRDGSSQIGEWTKEEWQKREAEAVARLEREKVPEKDRWMNKYKPKPINGWTADRVMSARRFGLRLAEAKSLNALGRNFGLKQIYSLEELKKPFVIFRATFAPDMTDPDIKKMVTAAELGATNLLFPGERQALPPAPPAPAVEAEAAAVAATEDARDEDAPFVPATTTAAATVAEKAPTLHISDVRRVGKRFYLMTKEAVDQRIYTDDEQVASAAHAAMTGNKGVHIETEKRGDDVYLLEMKDAEDDGL